MLVSAIVATVVSILVSLFFLLGISTEIDKLKKEIEILRAIVYRK